MNTLNPDEDNFIDIPLYEESGNTNYFTNYFPLKYYNEMSVDDYHTITPTSPQLIPVYKETPKLTFLEAEQTFKELQAYCASRGLRSPCYEQHKSQYPFAYPVEVLECRVEWDSSRLHKDAMQIEEDTESDAMNIDDDTNWFLENTISDIV